MTDISEEIKGEVGRGAGKEDLVETNEKVRQNKNVIEREEEMWIYEGKRFSE